MGSEQQGFWELRRQPRALLGTEAKRIKKDTAHVGLLGRRVEGVGGGEWQKEQVLSRSKGSPLVPQWLCSRSKVVFCSNG